VVEVEVDHRFKINMGALGTEAHRGLVLEGTVGKPSTQRFRDPCNGEHGADARSTVPLTGKSNQPGHLSHGLHGGT
jgi:hypothetical protein